MYEFCMEFSSVRAFQIKDCFFSAEGRGNGLELIKKVIKSETKEHVERNLLCLCSCVLKYKK